MHDDHLFDSLYLSLHRLDVAEGRLYVWHFAHEVGLQGLNCRLLAVNYGLSLIDLT